jgi:hypothetical protein
MTESAGRYPPCLSIFGGFAAIVPAALAVGFQRPGRIARALAQVHKGETGLTCISSACRKFT